MKPIIAIAQINSLVGDALGNAKKIISYAIKARDELKANLVIFPELSLSGYPPEDLLLRNDFYDLIDAAFDLILKTVKDIYIIIGYPKKTPQGIYNEAAIIYNHQIITTYQKQLLPNYGVFDEKRYFRQGEKPCTISILGVKIGITICEDLWFPEPMQQVVNAGAELVISINASPFDMYKPFLREQTMRKRAQEGHVPIIYVNCIGGQDELVFDGGSMVLNSQGEVTQHVGFFTETLTFASFNSNLEPISYKTLPIPSTEERIYRALVLGVRDYIEKNKFPSAIIGLSGGIDSALTLCIAVDAIGKDRITAITMPSRFTRNISIEDAELQAKMLGVKFLNISIEPIFQACLDSLVDEFKNLPKDATEENIQARCRGILLMAISNKKRSIVLSTGNKSEMAVGYSTLYGDMVGGFCVLKDVLKTIVYRLADYRNKLSPSIPQRVIERAPSAELSDNQLDQDSLPPYPILDAILEHYVEKDLSAAEIISEGFAENTVKKVLQMVDRNEYKRRQAPPGVKITARAFGRDRRYPITSGFKID